MFMSSLGALRTDLPPGLHVSDNAFFAVCGDGRAITIHELRHQHDGSETVVTPAEFAQLIQTPRHL